MESMATWEDGPEYAPLERPEEFTSPAVEPLDVAPPPPVPAALPAQRPLFAGPSVPVAPLAALVPAPGDDRDPQQPFAVVSSNLTSGSAWGSAHQPAPLAPALPTAPAFGPAARLAGAPVAQPWPAAAPAPAPAPWPTVPQLTVPQPSAPQAPAPLYPFPAPGTPQWFGPGTYGEPVERDAVGPRQVLDAATPGLLLVLAIGAVVFVLSPLMLVIAFALSSRVRAAEVEVRRALGIALAAVGFFGVVGLTRAPVGFGDWWSFVGLWGLLTCWVMLITVSALVYRGLKRGLVPPPVQRGDWR
jgi:hypothetical protein